MRAIPLSVAALLGGLTTPAASQTPLRLDPLDQVVSDLRQLAPGRMAEERVPGMAIALIRDGRVAWTGGFGVTNSITCDPGERFDYSGVGFMCLQQVLEQVGGAPLDSVVARESLRPFGIERLWFGAGPAGRDRGALHDPVPVLARGESSAGAVLHPGFRHSAWRRRRDRVAARPLGSASARDRCLFRRPVPRRATPPGAGPRRASRRERRVLAPCDGR